MYIYIYICIYIYILLLILRYIRSIRAARLHYFARVWSIGVSSYGGFHQSHSIRFNTFPDSTSGSRIQIRHANVYKKD